MNKNRLKRFSPIALIFIILNALLIVFRKRFEAMGVDADVLIIANLILFLITAISFALALKGLKNPNPNAFVRSVYGSMIIKLFAGMIAATLYISIYQKDLNKPALFGSMGLYLLYTFAEVTVLTKLLRQKPQ
jgi:hypothetical protein